ncbi:MAG: single-stranded DNA-binding protein [Defluviitaleaceae bacterium]|nr:single-stranded DNA-binding protein [Defluviitaleaceae bacterium]
MLNQLILIGRTTRDVELKETTNGRTFGIVTLAVNRPFKNQETNTYDTDFIDVSLWGLTAESVAKYAGKGSAISIRGRVANRILDFPGEQTFRTISIVGQQVSFIQTKAPGSNTESDESNESFTLEDFPSGEAFDEAMDKFDES